MHFFIFKKILALIDKIKKISDTCICVSKGFGVIRVDLPRPQETEMQMSMEMPLRWGCPYSTFSSEKYQSEKLDLNLFSTWIMHIGVSVMIESFKEN